LIADGWKVEKEASNTEYRTPDDASGSCGLFCSQPETLPLSFPKLRLLPRDEFLEARINSRYLGRCAGDLPIQKVIVACAAKPGQ
jgi:hypothetical protein